MPKKSISRDIFSSLDAGRGRTTLDTSGPPFRPTDLL
jgi:hypothetical protein